MFREALKLWLSFIVKILMSFHQLLIAMMTHHLPWNRKLLWLESTLSNQHQNSLVCLTSRPENICIVLRCCNHCTTYWQQEVSWVWQSSLKLLKISTGVVCTPNTGIKCVLNRRCGDRRGARPHSSLLAVFQISNFKLFSNILGSMTSGLKRERIVTCDGRIFLYLWWYGGV